MNICKWTLVAIIFILFFSCNNIRIIRENEVRVSSKPLQINSKYHSYLLDTFQLDNIDTIQEHFGALSPKVKFALGIKYGDTDSFLFWKGCMIREGVSLIIEDASGFHLISNKQKLKDYFSPIQTPEEAISYACAYSGNFPFYNFDVKHRYRKYVDEIHTTYSIECNDGYEVNLFEYELCGCGPHAFNSIKYRIGKNGEINEIGRIKLFEDPEDDELCID